MVIDVPGNTASVLIVEDQPDILEVILTYLEREGYRCQSATDGNDASALLAQESYDLVVLDWMLPGMDGVELCRQARERQPLLSILMVSARGQDYDRISGLEAGADDYLPKPFHPRELVARARALLRRAKAPADLATAPTSLRIDSELRQVSFEGKKIPLTGTELSLMLAFGTRPDVSVTRQQLLDLAWGDEFPGSERTVDSYVRSLRNKLAASAPGNTWIESVWGVGYRYNPAGSPNKG